MTVWPHLNRYWRPTKSCALSPPPCAMSAPDPAKHSSCMPLRVSASRKLRASLAFPPKRCCRPFLRRVTTCARRLGSPKSFRRGSLRRASRKFKRKLFLGELVMTLSREQIRELAEFQDANSCAVSFYFQPATPRNKAHKEDTILIKDLAREAQHNLESKGKKEAARADLDRVVRLSAELRSNGTHAKAVFACAAQGFWREYELPAELPGTQLFLDRHFHLKPLAHLLGAVPRLVVVLADRQRARFFDLSRGELSERENLFQPLSRKGRSDGFAGYDGGHAQRRVEDEVRHHFKAVAEVLND